jgi:LmbE family N-acetylglucosaminyl deacetylase
MMDDPKVWAVFLASRLVDGDEPETHDGFFKLNVNPLMVSLEDYRELAAERDALRAHPESLQNRYAKAAAEVERLREALEPYATWGQEGEFARAALQEQER